MRFDSTNAAYFGRKGGKAPHKNRLKTKVVLVDKEELEAYEAFLTAQSGIFNGFAMVNLFHLKHRKLNAYLIDESDNSGICQGIHVGADGVICYFFCEPKNAKKQVRFNRSVYIF